MPQLTDLGSLKIEATDSFDDVNSLLYRLGLTDGLPIVPPTAQRVESMLGGRNPELALPTLLPPLRGRATLRKLAMCAVMAGCWATSSAGDGWELPDRTRRASWWI